MFHAPLHCRSDSLCLTADAWQYRPCKLYRVSRNKNKDNRTEACYRLTSMQTFCDGRCINEVASTETAGDVLVNPLHLHSILQTTTTSEKAIAIAHIYCQRVWSQTPNSELKVTLYFIHQLEIRALKPNLHGWLASSLYESSWLQSPIKSQYHSSQKHSVREHRLVGLER